MDRKVLIVPRIFTLIVLLLALRYGSAERRVVCYYTNWSVYRPGTAKFSPQNINPYLCTHLIYAFGGFTKDNTLKPFDKYQDIEKGGYAKFNGLKSYNKDLKTMLAIGGWNEGSSRFSPMVAEPRRRREFVKNAVKFLRQNHFDGLDLDWEYPAFRDGGKPRDKDNYADLVEELREEFERENSKTGRPRLQLSMAVPAGVEYLEKGYDIPRLNDHLDFFNVLSYDYHSAFEPAVNHHAPLLPLEEDNEYNYDSELTIDHSVNYLLKNGASPEKIVLGIPTYGRSYTLYNDESTDLGSPADGPGVEGDATREKGYLAYYEICENVGNSDDWEVVQPNPSAMGPYAFKGNQWVGYDDEDIVKLKARYVNERNLGGIMFWSIDNDDFRGKCHGRPYPLIEAAKEALMAGNDKSPPARKSKPSENGKKTGGQTLRSEVPRKILTSNRRTTTAIPTIKRRIGSSRSRPEARDDVEEDDEQIPRFRNSFLDDEEESLPSRNAVRNADSGEQPRRTKNARNRGRSGEENGRRKQRRRQHASKKQSLDSVGEESLSKKLTTPEPPTTPDPGSDFKCEDEGFFPHPRDCKKYFWCLDSGPSGLGIVAHQFTCPSGLVFNKAADSCDYPRNVICPKAKSQGNQGNLVTTTRAPITAATSRNTYLYSTSPKTTTVEPEEEYEYYEDEEEDEEEDKETERRAEKEKGKTPSTTTTPKTLLYKTISRSKPTTQLPTTTASLDVGRAHVEHRGDLDEEEDPRVIKELIDLIKKAGGIEQLEKQLLLQERNSGSHSEKTSPSGRVTPPTISRSLYERVLSRQANRNPGSLLGGSTTSPSASPQEQRQERRQNSRRNFENGPGGAQFQGLDDLPEVKSLRRSKKPQYVTIERQRPSTRPPEEDEDEDAEEDSDDVASTEERVVNDNPEAASSLKRTTPNYVNIRRGRPGVSKDENDVEKDAEINVGGPSARRIRPGSAKSNWEEGEQAEESVRSDSPNGRAVYEEEHPAKPSRYINIQRFRSTTSKSSESQESRNPFLTATLASSSGSTESYAPIQETTPSSTTPHTEVTTSSGSSTTTEASEPESESPLSTSTSTLPTLTSSVPSSPPTPSDAPASTSTVASDFGQSTSTSPPATTVSLVQESATEILLTTLAASGSVEAFTRGTTAAVSQPRPFGFPRRSRPTLTSASSTEATTPVPPATPARPKVSTPTRTISRPSQVRGRGRSRATDPVPGPDPEDEDATPSGRSDRRPARGRGAAQDRESQEDGRSRSPGGSRGSGRYAPPSSNPGAERRTSGSRTRTRGRVDSDTSSTTTSPTRPPADTSEGPGARYKRPFFRTTQSGRGSDPEDSRVFRIRQDTSRLATQPEARVRGRSNQARGPKVEGAGFSNIRIIGRTSSERGDLGDGTRGTELPFLDAGLSSSVTSPYEVTQSTRNSRDLVNEETTVDSSKTSTLQETTGDAGINSGTVTPRILQDTTFSSSGTDPVTYSGEEEIAASEATAQDAESTTEYSIDTTKFILNVAEGIVETTEAYRGTRDPGTIAENTTENAEDVESRTRVSSMVSSGLPVDDSSAETTRFVPDFAGTTKPVDSVSTSAKGSEDANSSTTEDPTGNSKSENHRIRKKVLKRKRPLAEPSTATSVLPEDAHQDSKTFRRRKVVRRLRPLPEETPTTPISRSTDAERRSTLAVSESTATGSITDFEASETSGLHGVPEDAKSSSLPVQPGDDRFLDNTILQSPLVTTETTVEESTIQPSAPPDETTVIDGYSTSLPGAYHEETTETSEDNTVVGTTDFNSLPTTTTTTTTISPVSSSPSRRTYHASSTTEYGSRLVRKFVRKRPLTTSTFSVTESSKRFLYTRSQTRVQPESDNVEALSKRRRNLFVRRRPVISTSSTTEDNVDEEEADGLESANDSAVTETPFYFPSTTGNANRIDHDVLFGVDTKETDTAAFWKRFTTTATTWSPISSSQPAVDWRGKTEVDSDARREEALRLLGESDEEDVEEPEDGEENEESRPAISNYYKPETRPRFRVPESLKRMEEATRKSAIVVDSLVGESKDSVDVEADGGESTTPQSYNRSYARNRLHPASSTESVPKETLIPAKRFDFAADAKIRKQQSLRTTTPRPSEKDPEEEVQEATGSLPETETTTPASRVHPEVTRLVTSIAESGTTERQKILIRTKYSSSTSKVPVLVPQERPGPATERSGEERGDVDEFSNEIRHKDTTESNPEWSTLPIESEFARSPDGRFTTEPAAESSTIEIESVFNNLVAGGRQTGNKREERLGGVDTVRLPTLKELLGLQTVPTPEYSASTGFAGIFGGPPLGEVEERSTDKENLQDPLLVGTGTLYVYKAGKGTRKVDDGLERNIVKRKDDGFYDPAATPKAFTVRGKLPTILTESDVVRGFYVTKSLVEGSTEASSSPETTTPGSFDETTEVRGNELDVPSGKVPFEKDFRVSPVIPKDGSTTDREMPETTTVDYDDLAGSTENSWETTKETTESLPDPSYRNTEQSIDSDDDDSKTTDVVQITTVNLFKLPNINRKPGTLVRPDGTSNPRPTSGTSSSISISTSYSLGPGSNTIRRRAHPEDSSRSVEDGITGYSRLGTEEELRIDAEDQSSRAQELAITLADPPVPGSSPFAGRSLGN
ncbi:mucin-17 [Orussus abietinus]|uniref:mucin-17 n=1 Tax=Orussus abietinus TaxID=222816 RepID=UPI000C716177|nr:mucin-17 [Orussus abietinus]